MLKFESNIVDADTVAQWDYSFLAFQEQAETLVAQIMHVTLNAYVFDQGNGDTSQHYLLTLRHLEEHEYSVSAAQHAPAFERHYAFDDWPPAQEAFIAALQHKLQGGDTPIM